MLTMVRTMNMDFLGGKAACVLCHRGSAVPDATSSAPAQQAQAAAAKPEEIVRTWFALWNALDGSNEATNKLLDLYRDDAGHEDFSLGKTTRSGAVSGALAYSEDDRGLRERE